MLFSGRIGDIVGCNGSKRSYIRSAPRKKQQEFSLLQLASHRKMAMASALLSPIRSLLEESITRKSKTFSSGYGAAMSQLLKNGFKGQYPDLEINYPELMFSSGSLARTRTAMQLLENFTVRVEWDIELDYNPEGAAEEVAVLIYSPDKNEYAIERNIGERIDRVANFYIPEAFRNQKLHYYFFFHDRAFKKASATHYLGFTS